MTVYVKLDNEVFTFFDCKDYDPSGGSLEIIDENDEVVASFDLQDVQSWWVQGREEKTAEPAA
jgi:hypothetical protein